MVYSNEANFIIYNVMARNFIFFHIYHIYLFLLSYLYCICDISAIYLEKCIHEALVGIWMVLIKSLLLYHTNTTPDFYIMYHTILLLLYHTVSYHPHTKYIVPQNYKIVPHTSSQLYSAQPSS